MNTVGRNLIKPSKVCSFHFYLMKKSKGTKEVIKPTKNESVTLPVATDKSGNIRVQIVAKPGAKVSSITGVEEEGVGVQIAARPVDGEANTELLRFIASVLKLKKSEISLDKGSKSRQKTLIITAPSLTVDTVLEKLKSEAGN